MKKTKIKVAELKMLRFLLGDNIGQDENERVRWTAAHVRLPSDMVREERFRLFGHICKGDILGS